MQTLNSVSQKLPDPPPTLHPAAGPSRKALIFLFLALVALYSYCAPRWNDWNQNSRLSLVRSVVDYGTVQIDKFASTTGDYAFYKGHYYSDKPPGPALAGIAPYALLKLAISNPVGDWAINQFAKSKTLDQTFNQTGDQVSALRDKVIGALARIGLSILLAGIPTALMICLFWRWAYQVLGRYWLSLSLALGLALGTTLFPYSSLFYNHALAASLLFTSFYLLWRMKNERGSPGWLVLVGFLLGFSVLSQYESVLIAVPLGLYALFTTPRPNLLARFGWLALGTIPTGVLLVGYDLLAFGTPLPVGYEYSLLWADRHSQGFLSLTYPHPDALVGLLVSPYRGIFLMSPFLLLAIPGLYFGLRNATYRVETLVCLWSCLAFWLFNASSAMWWGGFSFGPRYLIPCLPFLTFSIVFVLKKIQGQAWSKPVTVAYWLGLGIAWLVIVPASLAGREWPSDELSSPLTDYLWPQLFSGNLARNPGMLLGLKGPLSFLPLLAVIGLLYLVLFRWPRRGRSQSQPLSTPENWVRLEVRLETASMELRELPGETPKEISRARQGFPRFAVVGTALLVVITTLPYLFGYWRSTPDKIFMGIMLDVPDTLQYFAWMREMTHSWLIINPLTPEANDPAFFNLLWWGLAQFQRLTGFDQVLVYQLFRVGSIIFFGWLAWLFCQFILPGTLQRRVAFLLIMFGSGWGWIPVIFKQFTGSLANPLAVYVTEANSFLSALAFPHELLSAGLILAIFYSANKAYEAPGPAARFKWGVGAALLALILGLEHAYDLITVYAVPGCFFFLKSWQSRRFDKKWFQILLVIGLVSSPPSLYFTYLTLTNPTWKGVLTQYGNAGVFTPDPLNLAILLGPMLALAVAGLWVPAPALPGETPSDKNKDRWLFIKTWFVVGFVLIYIPTNFQIKLLNGWQIPIFVLGLAALFHIKDLWLARSGRAAHPGKSLKYLNIGVGLLALAIVLPTTLYLFGWRFVDLNRARNPYFLERDEISAMEWLSQDNQPPEVVLSSEELGEFIPALTGQRPFLAHWAMTLDYFTKRDQVKLVFDNTAAPGQRTAILKQFNVKYILYGSAEKQKAPELNMPGLQKVFTSPEADVYQWAGA
ncbi:MAG: hypothetical protein J0I20_24090 [Chloroflexi bacterium]|nr:hypothetical protein [Chloroflexota bacterium]